MWYVIQVRTRHEIEIVEECEEKVLRSGEKAFVMRGERIFHTNEEREIREYILFPGYVFIDTRSDTDDLRIRLRNVKQMTKLLSAGGEFSPIHPEEESFLKEIGGEEHFVRYSKGFKDGDQIVVTDGALLGKEGRIKWIDRHNRVAGIEVELLGRKVTVKLGLGLVSRDVLAEAG